MQQSTESFRYVSVACVAADWERYGSFLHHQNLVLS